MKSAADVRDLFASGKRDTLEIIAALTALAQKPSGTTHLMNRSNLSHAILTKYLKFMTHIHLIEKQTPEKKDGRKPGVYCATEKGLVFLKSYCELLTILYGEEYMKNTSNLAVACLQFCKERPSG